MCCTRGIVRVSDGGCTERETRAFGLPAHSVRALLALCTVIISGTLLLLGRPVPEWWITLVGVILAFYFKR